MISPTTRTDSLGGFAFVGQSRYLGNDAMVQPARKSQTKIIRGSATPNHLIGFTHDLT
jgi:hypothetical protein